ncbi:MAG: tetratricopeptide repeat protein [Anaerolineae bacterium]|nr:tetratricopeptide repeat protein [Anaerolineae bacterium]
MYIRRTPLGQGNLTFRKRRQRYSLVLLILYLVILLAALYVIWQADRLQPEVAAMMGPPPTSTPAPDELVRQAEEAYQAGDLARSIEFYRQASEIDPQNVQTLTNLARMLTLDSIHHPNDVKNEQLQEALAVAEKAILIAPEDPRGYAAKARALDWNGQYDSAVVAALRAIELDANYAPAHAYLAEAYADVGTLRLALEQAELAIQLDPYDVDVRRNYAYVLEFFGSYEEAVQQYIQALQLQPNMIELMYGLARNYRGAGQYDQAITTFREIMVRTPEDPDIYIEMGKTYYEIRDDDAAQDVLEHAVDLVCEEEDEDGIKLCPLHNSDEILVEEKDGIPFLERTDRRLPAKINMSAWLRLGQVYHARRNFESALEMLEEAIAYGELHNETVPIEAYYTTASDYYYLDRCEIAVPRAKQAFDVYLEREPKDETALINTLSIFVLCRDYTENPYLLTESGFTNGFPDGYEEPDVLLQRGGAASPDE